MRAYPRTAIYSLVDSVEVVEQLVRHGGSALAPGTRFQVLIELGYAGGRAGARTMEQALAVLEAVRTHRDVLELAGIEGYEGTINLESADETIHAVDRFLEFMLEVLGRARHASAPPPAPRRSLRAAPASKALASTPTSPCPRPDGTGSSASAATSSAPRWRSSG